MTPASEERDLNDSVKPLEWRYSRMDLWLEASYSEVKRDVERSIWHTDLLSVCLRGGTLLVMIKERGGVVFASVVVVVVAVVGCVDCRLSSVAGRSRRRRSFRSRGLVVDPRVSRVRPDLLQPPLFSYLAFSHHLPPLKTWPNGAP